MTRDEEIMDIKRVTRVAKCAHNEAIRQAKFEISLTLMSMRVHAGVESGLLKAMDGLILDMAPRDELETPNYK